jgi:cytochrome c-type biogenesis protein CcmH/NrfF
MIVRSAALAVIGLLAMASLAPAAAASCQKTSLLEIQDEVMCVICGVPLVNAGGPQSDDQREFIREKAAQCQSKQQIKDALVAEYGPAVLAMPAKHGFDLAAYLVPVAALLLALGAITAGALRWRRSGRGGEADLAASPDADALEDDLRRYDL